jgi:wyosine [tRNA(Phe)-imidazoG37] synthetase (radical SAM superfamily)
MKQLKTIYGPVSSWRLGSSLGIDLLGSKEKICSFDCVYCQLGRQMKKTVKRRDFVSIKDLQRELDLVLPQVSPDVITFSGMGEPTLARNIDDAISSIKKLTSTPLAILTNASLMNRKEVQVSLRNLDIVVAKIDAHSDRLFTKINNPVGGITLNDVITGIKKFKSKFHGKLAIQTMFIDDNIGFAEEISDLINEIDPDEVQINTPLRPCAVTPLNKEQISTIENIFKSKDLEVFSVYSSEKPKTKPLDKMEIFKRRRSVL